MTKIPEPAPSGDLSPEVFTQLLQATPGGRLIDLVTLANARYVYWDKFKYMDMPDGLRPEDAWRFLKVIRSFNRRGTRITDKDGSTFSYSLTDEVQRLLHVIDINACGPEDMSRLGIPAHSRDRYLISALMEEAIASSQIEGAATTRQVAKDMLRDHRAPTDRPEQMIANNYAAIQEIRDKKDHPLDRSMLLWLQATLTDGTLDEPRDVGRLRTLDDDIVVHDSTTNEVLFVPPLADTIEDELKRIILFANTESESFEHPVVKATLLHFWLAYLHPFADGNGRTARAIFYWYMAKSGYWLFEYLPVSRVIHGRRAAYEKTFLYSETDQGDLTYFILFNLTAIDQALQDLRTYLTRQAEDDAQLRLRLSGKRNLNHRQRAVLSRALSDRNMTISIESHQASHAVSYPTARADLLQLSDMFGYVTKSREGRAFIFRPSCDLREKLDT